MTVSSKVPVWARRVRAARGKESQESFAHRAGISVSGLSRIERGVRSPRWATAIALSEATGKPASFFLGETDDEEELRERIARAQADLDLLRAQVVGHHPRRRASDRVAA